MKMKSSPPMCPTNPSSLTHALHDVVEDLRENADDAIALVVRVAIVEFLEVIEIGVARRELRVRASRRRAISASISTAPGKARRRMHVQIAIGAAQHRVEPDRHLAVVEPIANRPRRRRRESRRRTTPGSSRDDHDGRNDAGVRIALEPRAAPRERRRRGDRLSNTTTRGRLRSATAHERFGVANPRRVGLREPRATARRHPAERGHRAKTESRLL